MNPRYTISADGKSITCGRCGLTSHNPHDVAHPYCRNCHVFHEEPDYPEPDDLAPVREIYPEDAEFDCSECGRHINVLCGPRPALDGSDRCAACMSLPGWFRDPEVARMIDPDGNARPGRLQ